MSFLKSAEELVRFCPLMAMVILLIGATSSTVFGAGQTQLLWLSVVISLLLAVAGWWIAPAFRWRGPE